MRVWHLLETYPPDYGGGAAITTRDICRFLADQGHEIRVLCAENRDAEPYSLRTEYDGTVRVDRINLPYFKAQDPDGWWLGLAGWRRHEQQISKLLAQLLSEWKPDLVDYHTSRPFGEECLISIASSGIPIVATLHDAWLVCPRLMLLRSPKSEACAGPSKLRCLECLYSYYDGTHQRALLKLPWRMAKQGILPAYRIFRRAEARANISGAIARSRFMARIHQLHLKGKIQHIPLGIDLSDLPHARPERPRTPLRFGFVAGFQQTKGILDVLDAIASLKQQGYSFELHVWGPGQERGRSEIKARNLEDRVLLRGMYSPEQRWQIYNEIDVAIMATTVCEPLGRVPLEAAAVGVPTIAPAVGGIPEIIRDGIDGLLYRFRDKRDLESQMKRLLVEPNLFHYLASNLQIVQDTRNRISAIEDFYFGVLGLADNQGSELAIQALSPVADQQ